MIWVYMKFEKNLFCLSSYFYSNHRQERPNQTLRSDNGSAQADLDLYYPLYSFSHAQISGDWIDKPECGFVVLLCIT